MNTIDTQKLVETAIDNNWESFRTRHPRLAAVMDSSLLVEEAMDQIHRDPEFQQAIQQAQLLGDASTKLQEIVQKVIGRFLNQIVG